MIRFGLTNIVVVSGHPREGFVPTGARMNRRLDRIRTDGLTAFFIRRGSGAVLEQAEVYFNRGHDGDGLAVFHAGFEAPFFYGFDGFLVQA